MSTTPRVNHLYHNVKLWLVNLTETPLFADIFHKKKNNKTVANKISPSLLPLPDFSRNTHYFQTLPPHPHQKKTNINE